MLGTASETGQPSRSFRCRGSASRSRRELDPTIAVIPPPPPQQRAFLPLHQKSDAPTKSASTLNTSKAASNFLSCKLAEPNCILPTIQKVAQHVSREQALDHGRGPQGQASPHPGELIRPRPQRSSGAPCVQPFPCTWGKLGLPEGAMALGSAVGRQWANRNPLGRLQRPPRRRQEGHQHPANRRRDPDHQVCHRQRR